MTNCLAAGLAAAIALLPAVAIAADMPPIRTSERNQVAECATPGRLTAYLKSRNEKLDPRFEKIAVEYMRHGERLGIRWDYTFYQMLLETGHLSFRGDRGRRGDVSPSQNNFAGLGATGRGAAGESFPDVSTGVLAHLQHVLVYSGETVDAPVAERTRKIQEWGILKSMQQRAKGSVTFAHLATKWAPGADYVSGLQSLASRFQEGFCNIADPHPEWVQEARGTKSPPAAVAQKRPEPSDERPSGAALARQAIAESKAEGPSPRQGLGLGATARAAATATTPAYSLLNPQGASEPEPTPDPAAGAAPVPPPASEPRAKAEKAPARPEKQQPVAVAQAGGALAKAVAPKATPQKAAPDVAASAKCRVWTASYGGEKALIIRVKSERGTEYTVLHVNEGAEKREAEAYIAAYAKGGEVEAEFASQDQALEKAFELCPEQ